MKAATDTKSTFVNLMKVDAAELNTSFETLTVQASRHPGEDDGKQENRHGFSGAHGSAIAVYGIREVTLEVIDRAKAGIREPGNTSRLLGGLVGEIQFVSVRKDHFGPGIAAAHIGNGGAIPGRAQDDGELVAVFDGFSRPARPH